MPRTHYQPSIHVPMGYAIPLLDIKSTARNRKDDGKKQSEDKPTILIDPFAPGMERGLTEAVCMALELWEPVFDHYEDPTPLPQPDENESWETWDTRRVPVFRGRDSYRVREFMTDLMQYFHAHRIEPDKDVILKIAAKFVHIHVTPLKGMTLPYHHPDVTRYQRDVIRPYVRRSDPEWNREEVIAARAAMLNKDPLSVHQHVMPILHDYDENRHTALADNYDAVVEELIVDSAPDWEHWRLVAHYVQDIADTRLWRANQGLEPKKEAGTR